MMAAALADSSHGVDARSCEVVRVSRLRARFVDPLSGPEWDRLVLTHPGHNFFHTAAWAKVLCETYGHKPFYVSFSDGSEQVALVPLVEVRSAITGRRGVCLPFADFCEPLIFGGCESTPLIDGLARIARERNWKYFEVRGGNTFQASAPAVAFYGHEIDLRRGSDELFIRFASSVRRAIRKAEKSGLSVQLSQTRETIRTFYRLHVQTRRRHGIPPQPMSFFQKIHDHVIKPGLGFITLVHSGSRPVAAAVFFHFGKKAVYKFGACNEDLQELRGNNLAMWEGIKSLAQRGVETLHLGRTSLENSGLRRFKLSWAAAEETIEYLRFDPAADKWVIGRDGVSGFHTTLFSRLPLPLNQMIGALVYPHLD